MVPIQPRFGCATQTPVQFAGKKKAGLLAKAVFLGALSAMPMASHAQNATSPVATKTAEAGADMVCEPRSKAILKDLILILSGCGGTWLAGEKLLKKIKGNQS
ncbi:MAG TPA: hypothetical protein V6C52_08950 [Coleofasciculaceae cyanobacterium]